MKNVIVITPTSFEITVGDCPPGLFVANGVLCFKTEYSSTPYVAESGEVFHGGALTLELRDEIPAFPCEWSWELIT